MEPKPEDITPEELDKLEGVDEEEKKALIRKIMKKNRSDLFFFMISLD